jgi:hypothetical protein
MFTATKIGHTVKVINVIEIGDIVKVLNTSMRWEHCTCSPPRRVANAFGIAKVWRDSDNNRDADPRVESFSECLDQSRGLKYRMRTPRNEVSKLQEDDDLLLLRESFAGYQILGMRQTNANAVPVAKQKKTVMAQKSSSQKSTATAHIARFVTAWATKRALATQTKHGKLNRTLLVIPVTEYVHSAYILLIAPARIAYSEKLRHHTNRNRSEYANLVGKEEESSMAMHDVLGKESAI